MKRFPTLILALVALVALAGSGAAQEAERTGKINGDVIEVYPTPTFVVMIQGRAVTFSAAKLSELPTVGENIDVTFTWEPDGPLTATSTTKTRAAAGYHCRLKGTPLYSLNLTVKCGEIWRTDPSAPAARPRPR